MESNTMKRVKAKAHATLDDYTEYNIWDYTAEPGLDCIDPADYWEILEESLLT